MAGRFSIHWAAENVPAILEAWIPGAEGAAAITNVLFGDANPGGKLPVTWARTFAPAAGVLQSQPDP